MEWKPGAPRGQLQRGYLFRHPTKVDAAWTPEPWQKFGDGPHELCEVLRASDDSVTYRVIGADGKMRGPLTVPAASVADAEIVGRVDDHPIRD